MQIWSKNNKEEMTKKEKWFEKSYRRALADSHIADWDEGFLAKFEPKL